jgi:hypothetical protein
MRYLTKIPLLRRQYVLLIYVYIYDIFDFKILAEYPFSVFYHTSSISKSILSVNVADIRVVLRDVRLAAFALGVLNYFSLSSASLF